MKKIGKVLVIGLLLFTETAFSSEIKLPSCGVVEQYASQNNSKFSIMQRPNPNSKVWMEVFNKELASWTSKDVKHLKAMLLLCISEHSEFLNFNNENYFISKLDAFINSFPAIIQSSKEEINRKKQLQEKATRENRLREEKIVNALQERKKLELALAQRAADQEAENRRQDERRKVERKGSRYAQQKHAAKVRAERKATEEADAQLQKHVAVLAEVEKQYKDNSLSDDDMAMLEQAQLGLEAMSRNDVTFYGRLVDGRQKAAELIKTIEARPVYKEMNPTLDITISGLAIGIECAKYDVAFNNREIERLTEYLKNQLDPLELADGVLDKMWEEMMIRLAAIRLTEADCLYQHQLLSRFLPKGILDKSISAPFK